MKKKKPFKMLRKETWELMSKYVRLRDKRCVTCGVVKPFSQLQAGHFIHGKCMDFIFTNIHAQCVRCNKYLSGNGASYANYLVSIYNDGVIQSIWKTYNEKKGKEYTYEELIKLNKLLRAKIRKLEGTK